ncbi:hypothetical protein LN650_19385 [Klebsiella pneumoniae subsp. pneumoniae]|nr:hypothetical protein [Klebsiella pneumoniae subsp. pneumoniae]
MVFDMTVEATLTKLHYLLSQQLDVDAIRAAMQQNLRGELTPRRGLRRTYGTSSAVTG